jgi:hypothetical protein
MGGVSAGHDSATSRGLLAGLAGGRRAEQEQLREEVAALRRELDATRSDLDAARAELDATRRRLEGRDVELRQLRAELAALSDGATADSIASERPSAPDVDLDALRGRASSLNDRQLADLYLLARDEFAGGADQRDIWSQIALIVVSEAARRQAFTAPDYAVQPTGLRRLLPPDEAMSALRDAVADVRDAAAAGSGERPF